MRRPITTRMPLNEPEANPDWQKGQEWVNNNTLAQAIKAHRAFQEKTATDAANYVLKQGGSAEAAQRAYREVMSGFSRSETMPLAMMPVGPKGATSAGSAPVREALALTGPEKMLALPAPRYAPGSAASNAANAPRLTLNEQRAQLGLPSMETAAELRRPLPSGPAPGSAADIARNRPILSLEEQRAALGLPPAGETRAVNMQPPPRGPAPGSAADIGAQRNANWANMTEAEKRRALGLPAMTEADVRATEIARMADEGSVASDMGRMQQPRGNYLMPQRAADPVEANSARTLARLEEGSAAPGATGSALERTSQPTMRDIGGQSAGSSPSYGAYNFSINRPPSGPSLPMIAAAGAGGLGGLGLTAYMANRSPSATSMPPKLDPYQFTHMPSGPSYSEDAPQMRPKLDPLQYSHGPVAGTSAPQRPAPMPPSRPAAQAPAPTTVNNLLRSIFSGEDYQSTGQRVREDKKINWGDNDVAADFFRADRARMEMGENRASGGRTGGKQDATYKALEIIHHLIAKG